VSHSIVAREWIAKRPASHLTPMRKDLRNTSEILFSHARKDP